MKKLMVMVAAFAMLTGSAYAADWDFYGSARIATFWQSSEVIGPPTPVDDVDTYSQALQGNARIGATVKVSDELTGGFEYGASGGVANIRKLYGEWNFGGGKFLVGQTYSPLNMFYSNQVVGSDNDLLAQGGVYSGREKMLQLTFGDFKIAMVPTKRALVNDTDSVPGFVVTNEDDSLPGFEASYAMKMDNFGFKLAGGYQSYDATVDGKDDSVDSYMLALGGNWSTGSFYVGGNIYAGQNVGNLIFVSTGGDNGWDDGLAGYTRDGAGTAVFVDNDAFGLLIAAGYTFNDMFSAEIGWSMVETEYDINGASKDKCQAYYLQSTITMAPGVFVVPELGVFDGDEAGDRKTTYFGAKWQINF